MHIMINGKSLKWSWRFEIVLRGGLFQNTQTACRRTKLIVTMHRNVKSKVYSYDAQSTFRVPQSASSEAQSHHPHVNFRVQRSFMPIGPKLREWKGYQSVETSLYNYIGTRTILRSYYIDWCPLDKQTKCMLCVSINNKGFFLRQAKKKCIARYK